MKKKKFSDSVWKSLFSISILGIFILLAIGSEDNPRRTTQLANDDFQTTMYYPNGDTTIYTGWQDEYGHWHGEIKIEYRKEGKAPMIEIVNMDHGNRFGESTIYYGDGKIEYHCYRYGWTVPCQKSAGNIAENPTAFKILENKYPWYLFALNASGFSSSALEAYMDTMENILGAGNFEEPEFDEFYDDALSSLNDNLYDNITYFNSLISLNLGLDLLKFSEFRMAVIDGYRADNTGTFRSLKADYPNYLLSITDTATTELAVEGFCHEFDSIVSSYGVLDLDDPFLLDSLDDRMYLAMEKIAYDEKSATLALLPLKSALIKKTGNDFSNLKNMFKSMLSHFLFSSDDQMVAAVITAGMLQQVTLADKIKQSLKEAWLSRKSIPRFPVITTELISRNSTDGASFQGYLIDSGGAEITNSGIVWAEYFNPTLNDQLVAAENGNENFIVSVNSLTPGKTYFARAFATNSAGTSYGNCVSFNTSNNTGTNEITSSNQKLNIFPNPTADQTTFRFQLESSEKLMLKIFNINGQIVFQKELGILKQGENQIQMNLSALKNGFYTCQLTGKKKIFTAKKFMISR
ncbi:MAG: T9SS type A sorting domain-containing protein [Prolixibacteraceae bacterium]